MRKTKLFVLILTLCPFLLFGQKKEAPSVDSLLKQKWSIKKKRHSMDYPMVHNGLVFPSLDIEYAVEAKTGEKLFFDNKEDQNIIKKHCKDSLVCFNSDYVSIVINIFSGEMIMKTLKESGLPLYHSPFFVKDSMIFLVKNYKTLEAYNVFSKEKKWTFKGHKAIYDDFLTDDNKIYLGDHENIYCLNKINGKLLWNKSLEITSNMVLKDNVLYVFTENNGLCAINTNNQKIIWKFNKDYHRAEKIKIIDDKIYSGSMFALSLKGKIIWAQSWKLNNIYISHSDQYSAISDKYVFSFDEGRTSGYGFPFILNKQTGRLLYYGWSNDRFNDPSDEGQKEGGGTKVVSWADNIYNNLLIGETTGKIYCFEITK